MGRELKRRVSLTVSELVEDYIYTLHHKLFPVTDGDRLLGCVTKRDVKATPRDEWHLATIADIMSPCSAENTIAPDTDAMKALMKMSRHDNSRLMVVDGDRLVGIVTLKDLTEFITLKLELQEVKPHTGRQPRYFESPETREQAREHSLKG
ncbi:MAG: CBS domain-containing protein [Candidatus Paceibacterota bacterium]